MSEQKTVLAYGKEVVPPWWARFLLRPVGWVYFGLAGVATLWGLWECRVPNPFGPVILMLMAGAVFGGVGLLRGILQAVLWKVYMKPWREFWRTSWRYGVMMVWAAVVWGLVGMGVPTWLAFQWSKGAMKTEAERMLAALPSGTMPATPAPIMGARIGLFTMHSIKCDPDSKSVEFIVEGSGFLGRNGWTYCPGGTPPMKDPYAGDTAPPWYEAHEKWF